MKKLFWSIAFAALAMIATSDDGAGHYNPKIGSFTLTKSECVRMAEETVDIWMDRVKVAFTFVNVTKEPVTVALGFPVTDFPKGSTRDDEDTPIPASIADFAAIEAFYGFTSSCEGKPLPRKLVRDAGVKAFTRGEYPYWFTANLTFKPGETLHVVNEYRQTPDRFEVSSPARGWSLRYVLRTGASWAGSIGKALLRFHTGSPELPGESPSFDFAQCGSMEGEINYSYEPASAYADLDGSGMVVEWILRDLEPAKDWLASYYEGFRPSEFASFAWCLIGRSSLAASLGIDPARWPHGLWGFVPAERFLDEWLSDKLNNYTAAKLSKDLLDFHALAFNGRMALGPEAKPYARFIVNALYALHGYRFKDGAWAGIFSAFPWYSPRVDDVKDFSEEEAILIASLKAFS